MVGPMAEDSEFDQRLRLVEEAIDRHGSYLQQYLYGLTKQWQDAENLFNDLWVNVLHRFPKDKITHVGFLRRKCFQLFVDQWRRSKRNPVTTVEDPPDHAAPLGPGEAFTGEEEAAFKERFFSEYAVDLTPQQKDALWLHARFGYTYVEIAEKLGIPPSTIGDLIKHARKIFAEHLNET